MSYLSDGCSGCIGTLAGDCTCRSYAYYSRVEEAKEKLEDAKEELEDAKAARETKETKETKETRPEKFDRMRAELIEALGARACLGTSEKETRAYMAALAIDLAYKQSLHTLRELKLPLGEVHRLLHEHAVEANGHALLTMQMIAAAGAE
tara:strand:- start:602 stop:1051 length:450 start_codon:yes stop_codon:yes gene_type:complete